MKIAGRKFASLNCAISSSLVPIPTIIRPPVAVISAIIGSVRMVEAVFPKLKGQGAEEGMCFSDAFTISARSMAIQVPAEEPKG